MIPAFWVRTGLEVAPKKNQAVKWTLLTPLLLMCLYLVIGLILIIAGAPLPQGKLWDDSVSSSLSIYWQTIIYTAGFIMGTGFIAAKSPEEIVE
jgi:hypothetical protein